MILVLLLLTALAPSTFLVCRVTAGGKAIAGADVVVAGATHETGPDGEVRIPVEAGSIEVTVTKEGFAPVTATVVVNNGQTQPLEIELQRQPTVDEHVTVSATRTGKRVEDQPMRVEVLDQEDLEEEQAQTPGDITMVLNEKSGVRVQTTSPGLGAATIRIQGMRGHYTRVLSDGLPLFGDEAAGLELLQIPPADLGRIELIKGVASALYGAGALGGVIDLISRRPEQKPTAQLLLNGSSRGAADAVFFGSTPLSDRWSGTLLASGNFQQKSDTNADRWADIAGYSRAVVRPRLYWDDKQGDSLFVTGGATWERRRGGTLAGATLPGTGAPFAEDLQTGRIDGGFVAQTLVAGRFVVTARGSATHERLDHVFGDTRELSLSDTVFGELAVRGTAPRQTWVIGGAFDRSVFDPRDVPRFAYTYNVPAAFAQDDVDVARWLTVSASGRIDVHNVFGTFASPRVSALVRDGGWSARASIGTGFFAPVPLIDETQTAGLARLSVPVPLEPEHGRSTSIDLTRTAGPVSVTATLFTSTVRDPIVVDEERYSLQNLPEPTNNTGLELLGAWTRAPFSVTETYTYVHSREGVGPARTDVPLTPRHNVGLVGAWDEDEWGRIVFEWYYTGQQYLEGNSYRTRSEPYIVFGALVERRLKHLNLFINAENLGNVRQTRWDPLLRPRAAASGDWTVDAWAPLDGRVVNAGIRLLF